MTVEEVGSLQRGKKVVWVEIREIDLVTEDVYGFDLFLENEIVAVRFDRDGEEWVRKK